MSVIEKIQSLLPAGPDDDRVTTYECQECGNTFDSAKSDSAAKCMECLSTDIEPQ